MKTYRVFEPGDAHHSHHDADDDGPEAEESELGGGVALVPRAVRGVHLARGYRAGRGETVLPDNSEEQTYQDHYDCLPLLLIILPLQLVPLVGQVVNDVLLVHLLLHQVVDLVLKLSDFGQGNLNVFTY